MTIRWCICVTYFLLLCSCALQAAQAPARDWDPLSDLARLKQGSNPGRLQALKQILREGEISFELQTFLSAPSPHGRTQGTNLIMSFGDGTKEITIGAHYDAVESKEAGLIGGVVDNGSAAIIVVGLAHAIKAQNLRHRVRLVLYDMEEVGSPGSKAYIATHKPEIAASINLDISGMGSTVAYSPGNAEGTSRIRKSMDATCTELHFNCLEFPNFPSSDDRSFQEAKIPVVSVAFIPPLQSPKIQSLMKLLHTPEDNLEKVDQASLNDAVRFVLRAVLKLDEMIE